jgi:hypothetical protein
MDQVLEHLPKARQQARQRILEGQAVPNAEKILSLYEADVHVIVRNKAGAPVEFANTLFLAENPQGLIIDWEFFAERAPADSDLLPRSDLYPLDFVSVISSSVRSQSFVVLGDSCAAMAWAFSSVLRCENRYNNLSLPEK